MRPNLDTIAEWALLLLLLVVLAGAVRGGVYVWQLGWGEAKCPERRVP